MAHPSTWFALITPSRYVSPLCHEALPDHLLTRGSLVTPSRKMALRRQPRTWLCLRLHDSGRWISRRRLGPFPGTSLRNKQANDVVTDVQWLRPAGAWPSGLGRSLRACLLTLSLGSRFPFSAATLAPAFDRILPARKNDPVFQQQVYIKHRFKFF